MFKSDEGKFLRYSQDNRQHLSIWESLKILYICSWDINWLALIYFFYKNASKISGDGIEIWKIEIYIKMVVVVQVLELIIFWKETNL